MFRLLATLALSLMLNGPAQALDFVLGVSGHDMARFDYEIGLLNLALKKAEGDHSLSIVPLEDTSAQRMTTLLAAGAGPFNVMVTGFSRERGARLKPVPVPLTRGLLGYRIFIVNEDGARRLKQVRSLEDLKKISIGAGEDWSDTAAMRAAGFQITSAGHENLFRMVSMGRIEAYSRGLLEPYVELNNRSLDYPNLTVDDTITLFSPFDAFFFVAPGDTARHAVLLQGLERAYQDGSFLAYFENSKGFKHADKLAKIGSRTLIDLSNESLPDLLKDIPSHYWQQRGTIH